VVTPWRGEAGKAKLGCLVVLVLLVCAFLVGKDFGAVYLRYYQLQDEVKSEGAFAPGLSDKTIRDRLVARADTLGIPLGPSDWYIRRTTTPSEITIRAEYDDSVVVQVFGYRRVFRLHFVPGIQSPL
jgi:hypothetical protein